MISCTEFIPSYSELFAFLEERYGFSEVERYWDDIFDPARNGQLNQKVSQHGLRGCFEYWSLSLNEEAADFTMYLNEKDGWCKIVMHRCPSKGMLLELKHMTPYPHYCLHCDLYRKTVEKYGLCYEYDFTEVDRAACTSLIYDPKIFNGKLILTPETVVMDRRAGDNKYLHRDFHLYMNMGVDYLGNRFGTEVAEEYLRRYTRSYYAPLIAAVRAEGLAPLEQMIRDTYRAEEAEDVLTLSRAPKQLTASVSQCPAVYHIRSRNETVSTWYRYVTQTVYETIASETGLLLSLDSYDEQTGASVCTFTVPG